MTTTYFGAETRKALENFPITLRPVDLRLIKAIVQVKMAAADANAELKKLPSSLHRAITAAAQEIMDGKFDDLFVTDSIQGGAGTSMNMNVNEVIAHRASELLSQPGSVHYLDHVNMSQSTNDVVPTAFRVVCLQLIDEYVASLRQLEKNFTAKAAEFSQVLKVARTHLQDAVPITLGQEFAAYAHFVKRDCRRLEALKSALYSTNLGGTAIGTAINASQAYIQKAHHRLSELTGFPFVPAEDLIDATQNVDPLLEAAYTIQISAVGLSKICSDLRLLASGPDAGFAEIKLPNKQKGSTIMAGKINPVILEMINQVAFEVVGTAQTATLSALHGQLELNVMLPVLIKNVIDSFSFLKRGVEVLAPYIQQIHANTEHCQKLYQQSSCMATVLNSVLGYDKTAELVEEAHREKTDVLSLIKHKGIFSEAEMKTYFSVESLTTPLAPFSAS